MSRWTHSMCDECWNEKKPDQEPARSIRPQEEQCCFCLALHKSGIYIRADPTETRCSGVSGIHFEEANR